MKLKIFGKETCSACQSAKQKISFFLAHWNCQDKIEVIYYNLDTAEGLAEGAFYDVGKIPAVILEKDNKIIKRWDGTVPLSEELKQSLTEISQ